MSAKADRERAERQAAAREERIAGHLATITAAPDLVGAIEAALIMSDALAPHVPIGGGFLVKGRAHDRATFIVHRLAETGWTTAPKGTP